MLKNPWKKLSSQIVYKNNWIKLHEDKVTRPGGSSGIYAYLETNGPSVYIVAINKNDQIYLVGQYRYTSEEYSWELPAGNSDGQDLLEAAKRELIEETGLVAKNWQEIGFFWAMNGVVSEKCFVFIANELEQTNRDQQSEEGIDKVKSISLEKIMRMIEKGELRDGQSIAALMKAYLKLKTTKVNYDS